MNSIAIFSVATNKYLNYWKNMVISADKYLFIENQKNFHVFTDQKIESDFLTSLSHKSNVTIHNIENLGWPLATLKRYELIKNYAENVPDEILMHLDADMIVVPNLFTNISEYVNEDQMTLVRHPGFWRVQFPERFFFYWRTPKFIIKDAYIYFKNGGLGTWCMNKDSNAFVKRNKRKNYYCGAVWFGTKGPFLDFVQSLSIKTEEDLKNKSIPKWNDESYLNYWASRRKFLELKPNFCFAEDYPNLMYLNPVIIAVNK